MQIASNRNSTQASERTRAFLPLARWRERGPGGEGGDRATPSATITYATPIPCERTDNRSAPCPSKKQSLRGHSPHPPPLSPTRDEGSKTVRPRLQLAVENNADRKLAQSHPSEQASPRERFPPSPAGGRGGRGVRVATAQPQAQQALTPPQSHAIEQSIAQPHALKKSSHCAVFPLTPRPSPRPGARGARHSGLACN
jgi:hypothetical protein